MSLFARLIRPAEGVVPQQVVLKAEAYQTLLEADAIVAAARERAAAILQEAETAYEAERQRGYEAGKAESALDAAERIMATVAGTVDYFASVEQAMSELVFNAVRKILGDFDDKKLTLLIVRQALATMGTQKRVTLRVPLAHEETVKNQIHELLREYPGMNFVEVVGDRRVEQSGCILESAIGVVDASLDTQLQALRQALDKTFGDKSE